MLCCEFSGLSAPSLHIGHIRFTNLLHCITGFAFGTLMELTVVYFFGGKVIFILSMSSAEI